MNDSFPEAGAVINVDYKRTDGFVIKLTLRDETGAKVLERLEGAIKKIKEEGGVPYERSSGFPKKEKEYVPNRVCPICKNPLVYADSKLGKLVKCSTNKYDFQTKTSSGCPFVEYPKGSSGFETDMARQNDIPERQINDY